MFKFGFSSDDTEDNDTDKREVKVHKENVKWYKSQEILSNEDNALIKKILENDNVNTISTNGEDIKYVCPNRVLRILQNEQTLGEISALKAEQSHSDLLPAVYEGGLKIWECTHDLLEYIDDNKLNFENKKILDLGCGAGVLGIFTLKKESLCYFQDYNSDVIQYITIPNVRLNAKDKLHNCKFYSGDWQSFSELCGSNIIDEEKFNFIFTSETIYNTENYAKLHYVFETLLKSDGAVFLAAKSFYFGVGGGISIFKDFLNQRKVFKYSSCWKSEEGVKREILKITFIDT